MNTKRNKKAGPKNRWSVDEICILKHNYGKIKISQLANLLSNRSHKSIITKACRIQLGGNYQTRSISHRKHIYNVEMFRNININSCYWAGYIAADGYVNHNHNLVRLFQSEKDIEAIYMFKKFLQYNGPLHKKASRSTSLVPNQQDSYGIRIGNIDLCNDLRLNFNIEPNKTEHLKPPNLTKKEYCLAFIIGMIDGDGSVYKSTYDIGISFRGTRKMCEWALDWFNKIAPKTKGRKHINVHKIADCKYLHQWNTQGIRARNFYNELKKIPLNFRLSRKWCL